MSILDGLIGPEATFERGFADRLRAALGRSGMDVAALSSAASVPRFKITTALECGIGLNPRMIAELCVALGVSPNELFAWEDLVEAKMRRPAPYIGGHL